MLWKNSWWETRWVFLTGLVTIFASYGMTFGGGDYDAANWAAQLQGNASLSESERQALNNYQGWAWTVWFKLLFNLLWAAYAVVMGTVCLMTPCPYTSQGAAKLFTFSLPVSRRKVLLSHAAVGFTELFLIALIPSLLLPLIARLHGQWLSLGDTLVYALLTVFGGAVFFCFSFLLTVILGNWSVAFILMQAAVFALFVPFLSLRMRPWWNISGLMAGESYFYHGRIPWLGLLTGGILSAVFMFAAVRIYERRDL